MTSSAMDAIKLLTDDHDTVKKMFKEFENLSDRSKVSKKRLADQICQALVVHTQIENEIFYPAARKTIKDDDMMDEALVEHDAAKQLIDEIMDMDPDDDLYDAKLQVLSEQITHHVKEEEGEMFPAARKSNLDLHALGEEMAARKQQLESKLVS